MMKYMMLLFNEEQEPTPEAFAAWTNFEQQAETRGKNVSAAALMPAATATTVSIRNDETILTDGPFVDTKEQLGGYYIFDCANLDEAIEIAKLTPWTATGHIEVRPVMELPEGDS